MEESCEDIPPLARRKSWGQETVIDFTSYGEAIKYCCRQVQSCVRQAIGGAIDVSLGERDDAIAILVHARDLLGIGVE